MNWAADVTHAAPEELGGVLGLALPPVVALAAVGVVADGDGLALVSRDADLEPAASLVSDAGMLAVAEVIVTGAPTVGDVAFSAIGLW